MKARLGLTDWREQHLRRTNFVSWTPKNVYEIFRNISCVRAARNNVAVFCHERATSQDTMFTPHNVSSFCRGLMLTRKSNRRRRATGRRTGPRRTPACCGTAVCPEYSAAEAGCTSALRWPKSQEESKQRSRAMRNVEQKSLGRELGSQRSWPLKEHSWPWRAILTTCRHIVRSSLLFKFLVSLSRAASTKYGIHWNIAEMFKPNYCRTGGIFRLCVLKSHMNFSLQLLDAYIRCWTYPCIHM